MTPLDIQIAVNPIIKEWIVSTYGSETIQCGQSDFISNKIKYLLDLVPTEHEPKRIEPENRITIKLINFRIGGSKTNVSKRVKAYRYYLTPSFEGLIEKEYYDQLKNTFHNFVLGYVVSRNNDIGSQKEAIEMFCSIYGLSMNNINYEMLKKSWDRSDEKNIKHSQFLKRW